LTIRNICDRAGVFTLFFYPPFSSKASQTQSGITTINLGYTRRENWYNHDYYCGCIPDAPSTPISTKQSVICKSLTQIYTFCECSHKYFVSCVFYKYISNTYSFTLTYSYLATSGRFCYFLCYFTSYTCYLTLSGMCIYTISTYIYSTIITSYYEQPAFGCLIYTASSYSSCSCILLDLCFLINSNTNHICITHETLIMFSEEIFLRCCTSQYYTSRLYTVYSSYFIECVVTVFTPASLLPSSVSCTVFVGFGSPLTFTGSCTVLTLTIPLCYSGFIEVLENGESMIQIPLN